MKVKIKILRGPSAGKEVRIPVPECLIGRSDECHMRPKSEAVSRRHCAILVKDGKVFARDLNSRNGTEVNGELIQEETELRTGDKVTVGPLAFEVLIDHTLGGEKKSKVTSIKEAAARTTASGSESSKPEDSDISSWLEEADQAERVRRLSDPETRQLKLDETDQVKLQEAIEERAKQKEEERTRGKAEPVSDQDETKETADSKKKMPGKLPPRPEKVAKDSREAASDMLKKFFNKR